MTALPPYSRKPITLPDGTPVIGWSGPATPTAARCKCSHAKSQHSRGEGQCWSAVCGCSIYRADAETPAIPARFDERYDPSPEPIDRSIQ